MPYYVGGLLDLEPKTEKSKIHHVEIKRCQYGREQYLVAVVRLFAKDGCPTYHVVTGIQSASPDQSGSDTS
jgi:hypothetical protein